MIVGMVGGGGVEVKKYDGSFTTSANGVGSISCGFKPDLIVLYIATGNGYELVASLPVSEQKTGYTLDSVSWGTSSYTFIDVQLASVTSTGATVRMYVYSADSSGDAYSRKTVSYRAVKYTE